MRWTRRGHLTGAFKANVRRELIPTSPDDRNVAEALVGGALVLTPKRSRSWFLQQTASATPVAD